MDFIKNNTFHIVGISVRTTNQNFQAAKDIPALWGKFMGEEISQKIPDKADQNVYCIYTEYEGDHNLPYTTFLGHRVENLDTVPEGLKTMTFNKEKYKSFVAKGDLQNGAVVNKWMEIWETDLDRTYIADFEVYGAKAMNPADAEVDIYIGIK
jgi:predicted transcriptional regulator YdeE